MAVEETEEIFESTAIVSCRTGSVARYQQIDLFFHEVGDGDASFWRPEPVDNVFDREVDTVAYAIVVEVVDNVVEEIDIA